jgi:methylenetetrahydrofolate reductase (NADPH)
MKIHDMFRAGKPVISFEFFPPKTDDGVAKLYDTIGELKPLGPSFVSVTYGAGGSTRDRTVDLVGRIKNEHGIESMAHLTCVQATQADTAVVLDKLHGVGVENILALRGDPPQGETKFVKTENGFGYASELVAFIKSRYGFCVGGACYPECHVETPDKEVDLAHLVTKFRAGTDFLVTQLFFDNIDYFDFVRRARDAGVTCPIVPGIMPITNLTQVKRFTQLCGARIPQALLKRLEGLNHLPDEVVRVGIEHAVAQCKGLLAGGAPGLHFYTLNKSSATRRIFEQLNS